MPSIGFEPPINSQNRFAHIDSMRSFAVLVVVFAHAGLGKIVPGGSGVTIFFSISGFVITYIVLKESRTSGRFRVGNFYRNRAYKILPPLVVAIVIPTIVWSMWNSVDWNAFFGQVFFYYNWIKVSGGADVLPGTGVVWSLSIEEQFYLVFSAVWLLFVRSRHSVKLLAISAAFCAAYSTIARLVFYFADSPTERIYYGSDTRLDGIAYGVLLAIAYHVWVSNGSRPNRLTTFFGRPSALWLALALYFVSLIVREEFFRDTARYSAQSLSACMVIAFGLLPGSGMSRKVFYWIAQNRLVSYIGLASYSIYLCHLVVGSILSSIMSEWSAAPRFVIMVVAGVSAGLALYVLVELPVQRWKRRRGPLTQRADSPVSTSNGRGEHSKKSV